MILYSCLASLVGVFLLVQAEITHEGGSCGKDAIPYKIVVDSNGRPIIHCDTPTCAIEEDEYEFDRKKKVSKIQAKCSSKFLETVCVAEDEWTGGLIEIFNGTHRTLKTQCCAYNGLREAKELKSFFLQAGEEFSGGPVETNGRVTGFDLVKEIRKTVSSDNHQVQYLIAVYRMPCSAAGVEEDDDYNVGPKAFGVRNRRRMASRELHRSYDDVEPGYSTLPRRYPMRGPIRRRPMGGRRPLYREYYDYDYDYQMPRRRMYAGRGRPMNDRLWPVSFNGRQRSYGQENYETAEDPIAFKSQTGEIVYVENPTANQVNGPTQPSLIAPPAKAFASGPSSARGVSNYDVEPSIPAPVQEFTQPQLPAAVPAYQPGPAAPTGGYQSSGGSVGGSSYQGAAGGSSYQTGTGGSSYQSGPVPPPSYSGFQPGAGAGFSNYAVAPAPSYPAPSYSPSYSTDCGAAAAPACAPSYPSYSYSGNNGGLNNIFTRLQCFSGDQTVETPSGSKKMSELKVGDLVLSIDENMMQFSPVVMFLHKVDNEEAQFNKIKMENGVSVELTDHHLIYRTDCGEEDELKLVHAKDVKVGECMHISSKDGMSMYRQKVSSIEKVSGSGIYAPLTTTGDIFVNGVLSSCHSNLALKTLQQTFFSLYRKAQLAYNWVYPAKVVTTEQYEVPFGVEYLTTVMDLFLPKQFF